MTAWCANAAGWSGGSVHDSGVRCGGTRNTCPGGYIGYEYKALAVEYGIPTLAKWLANLLSASNISLSVVLLLFSNGLDNNRDMLNGRFSLDDRVCSDCIESL